MAPTFYASLLYKGSHTMHIVVPMEIILNQIFTLECDFLRINFYWISSRVPKCKVAIKTISILAWEVWELFEITDIGK